MTIPPSTRTIARGRRGFSLIEATVAVVLLLVALTTAARAVSWILRDARSLDDRSFALREAEHVLDRLVAGTSDEDSKGLSPEASRSLVDATIEVDRTVETSDGVTMERIRVSVSYRDRSGSPAAPVRLTTWIAPGEDGS